MEPGGGPKALRRVLAYYVDAWPTSFRRFVCTTTAGRLLPASVGCIETTPDDGCSTAHGDDELRMTRRCLAGLVPHPVGRGALEREAVHAVAVNGARDVEVDHLAEGHGAYGGEHRPVDRGLRLGGDGALVPRAVGDRVDAPTRDALGVRHVRHLQPQTRRCDLARADAAHTDAEERVLDGAAVDLEPGAPPLALGGSRSIHHGVGLDDPDGSPRGRRTGAVRPAGAWA